MNSVFSSFSGTPLWSSDQSSWLQMQGSGFDSRRCQIFWEAVGLERDPLSLVSTIEELLGRKSSGSCLESQECGRRDPSRWPRGTLYPHKLALTSPTNGGLSVGIVRSWTQATEFVLLFVVFVLLYSIEVYFAFRHISFQLAVIQVLSFDSRWTPSSDAEIHTA
jgi:hypothetical protein